MGIKKFFITFSVRRPLISAPKPKLDKVNLINKKKGKSFQKLLENEISFEAANVLKLGRDLLYLVSRSGNRLAKWLQQVVGKNFKVHITGEYMGESH